MATNLLSSIEDVFAPTADPDDDDDGASTESTVDEALECDYDRDCTPLYLQLEKGNFDASVKFLKDGFWPGAFFADTLLPSDQAMTWVTRFQDAVGDQQGQVKWSQLPLHLAIVVGAPARIIVSLVELYPQGVRCTDDQHMLPLHLAMRHGATDEVVEYLLRQFAEAVNAKGKNDRTPLECARRGPHVLRSKIIEAFVNKTRDRAIKNVQAQYEDEIKDLETALWEAKNHMAVQQKQTAVLQAKIHELQKSRLVEGLESQTKIENLHTMVKGMEQGQSLTTKQRRTMAKELESVEKRVAASSSKDDLNQLKQEVFQLKQYRLDSSRNTAREELEAFQNALQQDLKLSAKRGGKTDEEVQAMQAAVEQLQQVHTAMSRARSSDEIDAYQADLEGLKQDLKAATDTAKTKSEVLGLRKQLERELREPDGKSKDEITKMKKALQTAEPEQLNVKSFEELTVIKTELESVKMGLAEKELAAGIQTDIVDLKEKIKVELDMAVHTGEARNDLIAMQVQVDQMSNESYMLKSKEDLTLMARQLDDFKEILSARDDAATMIDELDNLRLELDQEIRSADGKAKRELKDIKKDVAAMSVVMSEDGKSKEEWGELRTELATLKQEVKEKKEIAKMRTDLVALKKTVDFNFKYAVGNAKEEVRVARRMVNDVDLQGVESKGMSAIVKLKGELATLEKNMAITEVVIVKTLVEDQIASAEKKSGQELSAIRRSLAMVSMAGLEAKTSQELRAMKSKLDILKREVPEKKKKGFGRFFGGSSPTKSSKKNVKTTNALSSVITVTSAGGKERNLEEVETFLPPSLSFNSDGKRSTDGGVETKLKYAV